ncbi:hypothetical protein VTL71DRAFT_15153 [Oculimacula yallundae]|uniref:C2H2-type domain-containing protein n=1 Tax=Oculimacula yallundae TaxID=86028 RepID=A0ABR4CGD6_9HELO
MSTFINTTTVFKYSIALHLSIEFRFSSLPRMLTLCAGGDKIYQNLSPLYCIASPGSLEVPFLGLSPSTFRRFSCGDIFLENFLQHNFPSYVPQKDLEVTSNNDFHVSYSDEPYYPYNNSWDTLSSNHNFDYDYFGNPTNLSRFPTITSLAPPSQLSPDRVIPNLVQSTALEPTGSDSHVLNPHQALQLPAPVGAYALPDESKDSALNYTNTAYSTSILQTLDIPQVNQNQHQTQARTADLTTSPSTSTSPASSSGTTSTTEIPKQKPARGRRKHNKDLKCPTCSKPFIRKCDLNKHSKNHERTFWCDITPCTYTKGFVSEKDRRRHVDTVHRKSTFTCHVPGCEATFSRSDSCQRHFEERHL